MENDAVNNLLPIILACSHVIDHLCFCLLRLAEIATIIVDLGLILSSKFLTAFELNLSWVKSDLSLSWVWAEFELSMSWVWADDEEFFFTCCNFIVHLNFGMLVIWYECYYVLLSFHFERNALLSRCFVQGFVVKSGRFTHHVAELCEQRAELLGLMLESEGSTCRHVYVESWNIISPDQIYCRMNHRNTR